MSTAPRGDYRQFTRPRLSWILSPMLILLILAGCGGPAATGNTPKTPYYAGKSIEVIIPLNEGGGTDIWARFVGPYLEKYIEGNPKVTFRNIPGGESIEGANYYAQNAPADGTMLLAASTTTILPYLFHRPEVKYDFKKMKPLMVTATGGVVYTSSDSDISSVKDLAKVSKPLVFGGIGPTGVDIVPLIAFDLLNLPVETKFGFKGRSEVFTAFGKGETSIDFQTTPGYQKNVVPMVGSGDAVALFSFGTIDPQGVVQRDPVVPDLPTVGEVYQELNGKQPSGESWDTYLKFLKSGLSYQKSLWVVDGAPPEAQAAINQAVEKMISDPDFIVKGGDILGGYPSFVGSQIESEMRTSFEISDATQQYISNMLSTRYKVDLKR